MSRDLLRQSLTVIAYLITVTVNAAANIVPINGQQTGDISDRFHVYVVPAGYVFGIWGVIYALLAAFTIYQARPSKRDDPVLRSLGWLPALTGLLNTAWLMLFQYEIFVLTVPVIVALLLTLIAIHLRLWDQRGSLHGLAYWAIRAPFSVYLGWITVATIANIAQTGSALGFDGFGLPPEGIAAAVLLIGLGIAVRFVTRFGDAAYGLVIVWAYVGILVKEIGVPVVAAVAGMSAAIVAVLVVLVLLRGPNVPLRQAGAPALTS